MKGILAILMAGIMMAAMVAPAMGGDPAVSTATVNNVPPTAEVDLPIVVNPNPCPDATVFYATGRVNDENSEADIVSIDFELNSTTHPEFIDQGLAWNTTYNDTAKEFNATITVPCDLPKGEYDLWITVVDNDGNHYWIGPFPVTITGTVAISVTQMTFPGGVPGDCVSGFHNVTNMGNDPVHFKNLVIAGDDAVAPEGVCPPLNEINWDGYDDSNATHEDEIMWINMTGTAHSKIIPDANMRIDSDPTQFINCGDFAHVDFKLYLPKVKPDTYVGQTIFTPQGQGC